MERGHSNQRGRATSTVFMTRLFGFIWTPSKAWILSHGTVRSLSRNNLLQNTSLSFLPVLLFLWTAKAKSWGELALPLKMTTVPLHFLPHHCVLYGLYRENHCVAFDLTSYSTWIWWWLLHDWNINSIVSSPVSSEATQHIPKHSNALYRRMKNKDIISIQILVIFQASFTLLILYNQLKLISIHITFRTNI